jgi:hypothetical protein
MSIGAAINTVLNSIPQMPIATAPSSASVVRSGEPPAVVTTDVVEISVPGTDAPTATLVALSEVSPAVETTDLVQISAEGAAAVADEQPVACLVAERLIFPFPFPNTEIDALLNNLRERENLERQMFRLQDDAIVDRKVGELASDGTSPEDLREQANELRKNNKHDEANELNQLSWLMDGRGIPEDDPGTERNELEDAGNLLVQRADDKQVVATLIGKKLDVLKEDFDELVENFDVDDDDDFHPPIFLAAAVEEVV